MSLHAQFRKDKSTVWIEPVANVELEVAHYDPRAPEYISAVSKITKPVRKLIELNLLTPERDREYAIKAFCSVVVKNWRTIVDREKGITRPEIEVTDGEWVTFSQETVVCVFTAYPQFYNATVEQARDLANFQIGEDEEKNSVRV